MGELTYDGHLSSLRRAREENRLAIRNEFRLARKQKREPAVKVYSAAIRRIDATIRALTTRA